MLIHLILCFIPNLIGLNDSWLLRDQSWVEYLLEVNRTLVLSSHETVSVIRYRLQDQSPITPSLLKSISTLRHTGSEMFKDTGWPPRISWWHNLQPLLYIQPSPMLFVTINSWHEDAINYPVQRSYHRDETTRSCSRTIRVLMSDHLQRTVCQRLIKISWEPILNDVLSWEIQSHLLKPVLNY